MKHKFVLMFCWCEERRSMKEEWKKDQSSLSLSLSPLFSSLFRFFRFLFFVALFRFFRCLVAATRPDAAKPWKFTKKKKKSPTLTLDFYWNWNKFRPASGRIPSSCVCFFSRWVSLLVPGIFRKHPENLPLEESQKTIWIGLRLMALPAGSGSSSHPAKCDTLMKWADSGVTFHW